MRGPQPLSTSGRQNESMEQEEIGSASDSGSMILCHYSICSSARPVSRLGETALESASSERESLDGINPFFSFRCFPHCKQFFDGLADRQILRQDEDTGAVLLCQELKCCGMVRRSCETSMRLSRAAAASTSKSSAPRKPASSAVWKSIAGWRRRQPAQCFD